MLEMLRALKSRPYILPFVTVSVALRVLVGGVGVPL